MFTLPVTAYNDNYQFAGSALDTGSAWYPAIGNGNYKGSTSYFTATTSAPSTHTYQGLGSAAPFTWGASDTLTIAGSYEAA
jgi:hypothetical protein